AEAVVLPFRDYFTREGAWFALAFILLYKLGDTMASAMTVPFYLELGYSKTEIGAVVKLFGFWATIIGGTLGGVWILRIGLDRALWIFGLGQMISTFGFAVLAMVTPSAAALATVVAVEPDGSAARARCRAHGLDGRVDGLGGVFRLLRPHRDTGTRAPEMDYAS